MINILKIIILLIILTISAYTDYKEGIIKNKVALVGIISGLVLLTLSEGIAGLLISLKGIVIPFLILFILFAIGAFGAGDIKLLCAVGSLMGWKFAINNFIIGIFISLIIMICTSMLGRDTFKRLKEFFISLFNMIIARNITEFKSKEEKKGVAFAISMLIAFLLQIILKLNIF